MKTRLVIAFLLGALFSYLLAGIGQDVAKAQVVGQIVELRAADWGAVGTSAANTALTVTRAAVPGQAHYVTGFCVTMRAAAVTVGEVELRSAATAVDRIITPAQGGMQCVSYASPVKLTAGDAANLVVPAGGTSVISTGRMQGYTR